MSTHVIINLPVADRRFNALLGRTEDDDDETSDSRQDGSGAEQLPQSFRDANEEVDRNKQVLELVMKSQGAKKLGHSL